MIEFGLKIMKLCRRLNGEVKKINKNKEFNFNKKMNSVFKGKRFIDISDRFKNKT